MTEKSHKDVGDWIKSLDVHTVDKFQGKDKDCIVISFVRSNPDGHVKCFSSSCNVHVCSRLGIYYKTGGDSTSHSLEQRRN